MSRLALIALPAALAPAAAASAPAPATGAYDNGLLIGYDPATHAVTGYFDMEQGGAPGFSCIFYLRGQLASGVAAIDTYFPDTPGADRIRGRLVVQGAGKLRLTLPKEHDGCGNVWHFADADQPADFDLATGRPWTAVRVVKTAKAYFYPSAGAAAHGRAYVVKGNGVGVAAVKPGWIQADFQGDAHATSGWLKESDLYPP
jgi:hypothetical protein